VDYNHFHVNYFGILVYAFYAFSSIFILIRRDFRLLSILFPIFSLIEGLFIDWRWNKLPDYDGLNKLVLGGLPSLLIAIAFPFIGYYLHHLLPIKFRSYMNGNNLFPFTSQKLEKSDLHRYFERGFIYSTTTLILHELSQLLNISSRNTFDIVDLIFIIVGSIASIIIYQVAKTLYS